jgi:short-subunit dehydrogenase
MRITLITGASGGIGEAFARRLAAEEHNLFLVARSAEKLSVLSQELRDKHGVSTDFLALDLTQPDADKILFDETEKRSLKIDWLINNAGYGVFGEFAKHDLAEEIGMIDLNIRVLTALTHRYLPAMRQRKSGVIINVASTASFQPVPFMTTYAATKAFVLSFSEGLWEENQRFGIEVLALCPGATATDFFKRAGAPSEIPRYSMQTPAEVVETALKGVRAKQSHIVSGWINNFGAKFTGIVPRSWIARAIGNVLRKK